MKRREYGYIRVSSVDQNENRQMNAMRSIGIRDEILTKGYVNLLNTIDVIVGIVSIVVTVASIIVTVIALVRDGHSDKDGKNR